MANRSFTRSFYSLHEYPVLIDCNFVVDSTNGNGLGLRSLKGPGVAAVFMNTSASLTGTLTIGSPNITAIASGTSSLKVGMPVQGTGIPAGTTIVAILSSSSVQMSANATANETSESITYQGVASNGVANPNPPAGYIYVQLQDNYNRYLSGSAGFGSPLSGTPLTSVTANSVYVIVSLGTATLAQWQAVGLPAGVVPNVGVTFVASSSGTIGGSAAVEVIKSTASGIDHIEIVGDPNQTVSPQQARGAIIVSVCINEDAVTAPSNGTVISLQMLMSNSSNKVQGE